MRPGAGAASPDPAADRPLRRRDRPRDLRRGSRIAATSRLPGCRSSRRPARSATRSRLSASSPCADLAGRRQQCGDPARRCSGSACRSERVGLITLDAHFDMRDTRPGPEQRQSGAGLDRGRAAGREHRPGRARELRQQRGDAPRRGRRRQPRRHHRRSRGATASSARSSGRWSMSRIARRSSSTATST